MKTLKMEFKCKGKNIFTINNACQMLKSFYITGEQILENVKEGDIVKIVIISNGITARERKNI